MTLPFNKTPGVLDDDDLEALDEYYCQPYYARDASKIAHIREYDWVQEYHEDEARYEIKMFGERIYNNDQNLAEYLSNDIIMQLTEYKRLSLIELFLNGLEFAAA